MERIWLVAVGLIAAMVLVHASSALAVGGIAVEDDFGASMEELRYVVVTGALSLDDAQRRARKECEELTQKGCIGILNFRYCGAYAVSRKHAGTGFGRTQAEATKRALNECGRDCRMAVELCEQQPPQGASR